MSGTDSEKQAFTVVNAWQSQSYWPIKGWAAPSKGTAPYFHVPSMKHGSEVLPDDVAPPPGWTWVDEWSLDGSDYFGTPDGEGWFYAASFDRLNESLRQRSAVGIQAKTSLVRKRRWLRTATCTTPLLIRVIQRRIEGLTHMMANMDSYLKEKEHSIKTLRFYEENRSFVYAQSLHLASQGTQSTMYLLKELIMKARRFGQFLTERAAVEREYALKLELLGRKFGSERVNNYIHAATGKPTANFDVPSTASSSSVITLGSRSQTTSGGGNGGSGTTGAGGGPTLVGSIDGDGASSAPNVGKQGALSSAFAFARGKRNSSSAPVPTGAAGGSGRGSESESQSQSQSQEQTRASRANSADSSIGDGDDASSINADSPTIEQQQQQQRRLSGGQQQQSPGDSANQNQNQGQGQDQDQGDGQNQDGQGGKEQRRRDRQMAKAAAETAHAFDEVSDSKDIVFQAISAVSNVTSNRVRSFSSMLTTRIVDTLEQMVDQIQIVHKEARTAYRKNIEICRLCENSVKAAFEAGQLAYKAIVAAAAAERGRMEEELNCLQGSHMTYHEAHILFPLASLTTDSSGGSGRGGGELGGSIGGAIGEEAGGGLEGTDGSSGDRQGPCQGDVGSSTDAADDGTAGDAVGAGGVSEKALALAQQQSTNATAAAAAAVDMVASKVDRDARAGEDLWVCIQKYRQCVRDSQEALCVFISEHMDLEMHQQILTNKMHSLFLSIAQSFAQEQVSLWVDVHTDFAKTINDHIGRMVKVGPPHPVLQSPFAKLQEIADAATASQAQHDNAGVEGEEDRGDDVDFTQRRLPKGGPLGASGINITTNSSQQPGVGCNQRIQYEDFATGVGVFSFTSLYHEKLPSPPGVLLAGDMKWSKSMHTAGSPSRLKRQSAWHDGYAVVTSDGYLHIINRRKCNVPDISFFLKHCEIVPVQPTPPAAVLTTAAGAGAGGEVGTATVVSDGDGTSATAAAAAVVAAAASSAIEERNQVNDMLKCVFELRPVLTAKESDQHSTPSVLKRARPNDAIYIRMDSESEALRWLSSLREPLSIASFVDERIEADTAEAMLESMPIIRGETVKKELHWNDYRDDLSGGGGGGGGVGVGGYNSSTTSTTTAASDASVVITPLPVPPSFPLAGGGGSQQSAASASSSPPALPLATSSDTPEKGTFSSGGIPDIGKDIASSAEEHSESVTTSTSFPKDGSEGAVAVTQSTGDGNGSTDGTDAARRDAYGLKIVEGVADRNIEDDDDDFGDDNNGHKNNRSDQQLHYQVQLRRQQQQHQTQNAQQHQQEDADEGSLYGKAYSVHTLRSSSGAGSRSRSDVDLRPNHSITATGEDKVDLAERRRKLRSTGSEYLIPASQLGHEHDLATADGGVDGDYTAAARGNVAAAAAALGMRSIEASSMKRAEPARIIPQVDKAMPLAKRHSAMIKQYEMALQEERVRVQSRVKQTRSFRIKEAISLQAADSADSMDGLDGLDALDTDGALAHAVAQEINLGDCDDDEPDDGESREGRSGTISPQLLGDRGDTSRRGGRTSGRLTPTALGGSSKVKRMSERFASSAVSTALTASGTAPVPTVVSQRSRSSACTAGAAARDGAGKASSRAASQSPVPRVDEAAEAEGQAGPQMEE